MKFSYFNYQLSSSFCTVHELKAKIEIISSEFLIQNEIDIFWRNIFFSLNLPGSTVTTATTSTASGKYSAGSYLHQRCNIHIYAFILFKRHQARLQQHQVRLKYSITKTWTSVIGNINYSSRRKNNNFWEI